jgi:hypothetical protein
MDHHVFVRRAAWGWTIGNNCAARQIVCEPFFEIVEYVLFRFGVSGFRRCWGWTFSFQRSTCFLAAIERLLAIAHPLSEWDARSPNPADVITGG